MIKTNIQDATKIIKSKIKKHKDKKFCFYTMDLTITTDSNEAYEITLFSDNRKSLIIAK